MKLALLYDFNESSWTSCKTITRNLIETYKLITSDKNLIHCNYSSELSDYRIIQLAKQVKESGASKIVVLDHRPHIETFLKYFNLLFDKDPRPEIIFHVFGDFTLYGKEWLRISPVLKQYPIKFICASERQRKLVQKFLTKQSAAVLPFPVDTETFQFSGTIRSEERKRLNLSDETVVFLYTGRLSLQKKITELTLDFVRFLNTHNKNAVLFLAGEFDDLGSPFTGRHFRSGEFYQRYRRIFGTIPEDLRKKIIYLGNLGQKKLVNLYNASDVFVSLSTHNDEDYGMSPAEALCTGLPAIITDWAGYRSFQLKNSPCKLVPVKIEKHLKQITYSNPILQNYLLNIFESIQEHRQSRKTYQETYHKKLSIKANAPVLKKILASPSERFGGFTPLMKELALAFQQKGAPFLKVRNNTETSVDPVTATTTTTMTRSSQYSPLYFKIYESYVSD